MGSSREGCVSTLAPGHGEQHRPRSPESHWEGRPPASPVGIKGIQVDLDSGTLLVLSPDPALQTRRVRPTETKSFSEVPDFVSIKLGLDSGPLFVRIHSYVYLTIFDEQLCIHDGLGRALGPGNPDMN